MAGLDFTALAKPLAVDNNLPVRMYLRSARNVLRQADVYRAEGNKVQLYIALLRFVNLVFDTIPKHHDVANRTFTGEREFLKKKGMEAMDEMEQLKPHVDLMKRLGTLHMDEPFPEEDDSVVPSYFPTSPHKSQLVANVGVADFFAPLYPQNGAAAQGAGYDLDAWARSINAPSSAQQQSYGMLESTPAPARAASASFPASLPFAVSSLTLSSPLPPPTSEALSRHSFFSFTSSFPQQTPAPAQPLQITYPSFDTTPISIPDFLTPPQAPQAKPELPTADSAASTSEAQSQSVGATSLRTPAADGADKEMISVLLSTPQNDASASPAEAAAAAAAAVAASASPAPRVQPMPAPALAQVHTIPRDTPLPHPPPTCSHGPKQPHPSKVADPRPGKGMTQVGAGAITTKPGGVKAVHISPKMMEEFMRMVQQNTKRNLETCGILAGNLKKGVYFVTHLILPKQEATSDSCSTLNEEEIFEVQDKKGLFQVGWIHTHPSQACFMSSIDLHTHYSYQVMLPEAIAIVMAPSDSSRQSGIFRLSDPGGMKVVSGCRQRGFHPHEAPADGGPIYVHSSHVFYNPKIKFEVIDIRSK